MDLDDPAGRAAEAEPVSRLSAELGRAALRAVGASYDDLNAGLFKDRLRRPSFAWTRSRACLGRWVKQGRCIEICEHLLLERGWGVLVEVLKHEMAHQFVDEVLGGSESAHGPEFRAVCQRLGIDGRAAGYPRASAASSETARLLERIAKLLALAESSNQHEAENAMQAAQRMMLKYNLELSGAAQSYEFRHLGTPTGRLSEAQHMLASILEAHFFVKVIWVPVWRPLEGKRGTVLEACGTRENLELASYVFDFLMHTAENLWRDFKKLHAIEKNAERRTYLAGVMQGFFDKLNSERAKQAKVGLVWVGDPELFGYYRRRHPRIRTTTTQSSAHRGAFHRGREAGQRIVLRRGVAAGPSTGQRLLRGR